MLVTQGTFYPYRPDRQLVSCPGVNLPSYFASSKEHSRIEMQAARAVGARMQIAARRGDVAVAQRGLDLRQAHPTIDRVGAIVCRASAATAVVMPALAAASTMMPCDGTFGEPATALAVGEFRHREVGRCGSFVLSHVTRRRPQSWDCGRHYCYFFLGVGFERQYALRFTLPLASLLSATQLQSLRALQAASSFKELHAGGRFAGAFLS